MTRSVLIFDASNFFIRHYVVNPTLDSNGESVGGTVGMIRGIKSLVRELKPDICIVIWDGEGGSRRRRTIYSEYKAGRKVRLNREYDFGSADRDFVNLKRQHEMTKKYMRMLGVLQVTVDDCEADDAIAYIARHVLDGDRKTIVSSDRDFMQLVDARTTVYNPITKLYYGEPQVTEKFLVLPENFIFMKALVGDSSDNIKGIGGFGTKTVVKLFPFLAERPATLADLISHAETNVAKSARYKSMLDRLDQLEENMQLMQLSSPTMSPAAARSMRSALSSNVGVNAFDVRLSFVRDGIQIADNDLLSTFKEQSIRTKNLTKELDGDI